MQERGASLVEVVMVLGLTGVTLAFAGESFVSAAMRQHAKAVTTELAAELRAAHALAIKRRERIRVVFEPDTSKMRTELADAPQALLRQYDYGGRGVIVEGLSGGSSVVFYPSGRAATPTTITLRNSRQERWELTVSIIGRVSIP
ncbi:MAG: hypothetical protein AUH74_05045 [Nitrospirae bacterium 13_1_40CM_4_62_6]|nr:MAG: hypothetical protein AUH74_05045 [Nitrospirae bacterium 13_1_40CM_4_62_6]